MEHDDTNARVRLSVVTPSLNHARFLRDTIESVRAQTFRSVEHIVIDGGSTDGSVDILSSYPELRWISEKDKSIVDAYRKGFKRVRGDYVVQCCVSDGFLDPRWFEVAVNYLDAHPEVALVWALPQYLTEDGALGVVPYAEFFDWPPPEDPAKFFAFWLATKFVFPEGNYVVRAEIVRRYFPTDDSPEHYRIHPHLGFVYEFMTRGYVARFLPRVVNYGRVHADQRGKRLWAIERPAYFQYVRDVDACRPGRMRCIRTREFVAPSGEVLSRVSRRFASRLWFDYLTQRLLRSKLVTWPLYRLVVVVVTRLKGWRGA
ncbi:MAG TPA: glycosyltransferase [Rhodocyclaceae bacterium]|nr:glycosyltransferase [Rhodocyclaceae bacterium]